MQQLLTGKKRLPGFSGEWKNIKLCEVLSERKEKNVEQNLRICSVAVQKGVVDQVEHLGRSYAAMILQTILWLIMEISYIPKVLPEIFCMELLSRTYCRKLLQFRRYMEYLHP